MKMVSAVLPILFTVLHSTTGSLMSRIGLTLGGRPAHLSQLDHTRQIPWAVKEIMAEEQRQQDVLPFLRRKQESEDGEDRPAPCVGICYYHKLQALQAREEMMKQNEVLKEEPDCETEHGGCLDAGVAYLKPDLQNLDTQPSTSAPQVVEFAELGAADDGEKEEGEGDQEEDQEDRATSHQLDDVEDQASQI